MRVVATTLIALLMVAGCSDTSEPVVVAQPAVATELEQLAASDPVFVSTSPETPADKWARSCALCHADGTGGAPRIGVADEWRERVAKGPAVLLENTIAGVGLMPPLGYCMDCTEADFEALIAMMVPTEGSM